MTTRYGLTLGKFLPFHLGHELLIRTAAANCDRLTILVGVHESDPWSFEQRYQWIKNAFDGFVPKNVNILAQNELDIDAPKDKDGTITDEKYWSEWLHVTCPLVVGVTHVFTSDRYGERIARELGAKWVPVDPERQTIPCSGTMVRSNLFWSTRWLPDYVRRDFIKTVAIVGPESTGKSTLAAQLARQDFGVFVPEYGRDLSVARNNKLDINDFYNIFDTQAVMFRQAKQRALNTNPLVVSDTEGITTKLWLDVMKIKTRTEERMLASFKSNKTHHDLYLVMAPSTPFVQDGTRVMTEAQRWYFFYDMISELDQRKKNYKVISDSDYHIRSALATKYIEELFKCPKSQTS